MDPVRMYLQNRVIPEDDAQFEQISRRAKMYSLVGDVLFRRGAHGVLMKCITQKQGRRLLEEIHGGL